MAVRLRMGVIGCGLIAQVMHLPYLRELRDRFEIAALCDLSPSLLATLGDAYSVPPERRFTRWEDLVQAPLDAVMILTSGSHAPAAIAAAGLGRHLFVEKPMCFSVAEGEQMLAAARAGGVRLVVGYMKRYDPAYERLLEELPSLQDLRLVRATTLESPLAPYVAHYPLHKGSDLDQAVLDGLRADDEARLDAALGPVSPLARSTYRWVLLDSLVHELNLLRGALGEPSRLEFADLRERGVTAVFSFPAAQCILTWVDLQDGMARYEQDFAFYSPERRLTLSLPSPFLRSMPSRLIVEDGTVGMPRSWKTEEIPSYEEAFKRELEAFYQHVVHDGPTRNPGEDGLRDVALCQQIVAARELRTAGRPRA
jgi:predicted dehydrogenase